MTTYHDLPAPSAEMLARSHALSAVIRQTIQQHHGKISFADFMAAALYHPQYGYYQQQHFDLGKHGDFTTAPEISPLFARCAARQCRQIFATAIDDIILELGAGTGRFALDCLTELAAQQALPQRYFIYEISTALRKKQQQLFEAERPDLLSRIEWLTTLPSQFTGAIIANEVLDAIPFQCFQIENQRARERMVTISGDTFDWQIDNTSQLDLALACDLTDGYQSEIQPAAMQLVQQLCERLTSGVILLMDYGYGQREYYHPQRNQGSLTCFYQHRKHDNPFLYPGLQDITTHVDFTRVIETAAASGATLGGFTTQAGFLLANGLVEMAQADEEHLSEKDAFRMHQAIKSLTMPTEMGDVVKVMALTKNINLPLAGFSLLDRRRDL
jgi:SAM-dependent MidA family methyltransferase